MKIVKFIKNLRQIILDYYLHFYCGRELGSRQLTAEPLSVVDSMTETVEAAQQPSSPGLVVAQLSDLGSLSAYATQQYHIRNTTIQNITFLEKNRHKN